MGDLHAQLATMEVCERRFNELMDDMGLDNPTPLFDVMRRRSEDIMRTAIAALPQGRYVHEMEIDGIDSPLLLRAALEINGPSIHVDWTGSASQVERGINESYNHAYAMTVYPIKCVLCPDIPNNEGAYLPISMTAPEGTIINSKRPAAVGSRQILGHCIANVVLAALGNVLPDRVLADCGSPSPRIVFSGALANGKRYNAALLLAGGMGGQSWRDGLSAAPFPSNPGTTSVEVIESATPLLFRSRSLRPDSGGPGTYRGGLGATTEVELRADKPGLVSVMTDRIHHPPLGFRGGEAGAPNQILLDGAPVDPKARTPMPPGSVLTIHTAGGGGYGPKEERDAGARARDEEYGYVSPGPNERSLRESA
jgi:N-methylhydantoinase B